METTVKKVSSVLVPTDFSLVCTNAVKQAIEIVKEQEGTIYILHVISAKQASQESEVLERFKEYLKEFNYTKLVSLVKVGDIFKTINEVAEENNVELILMGTHGKTGMQKFWGSNALKVIDSTKIPLIVCQNKLFEGGFKNILFPVSIYDQDRQKTSIAIKLAKMFGSKINIFPCYETSKKAEKQMINSILQIKSYFNKYEIDYEVAPLLTSKDNFQKKILAYSEEINADLILIVTDPTNHLPILGGKEEVLLFNDNEIPILCIENKKTKSVSFSTSG